MKKELKYALWIIDVDGTMTDGGIYYDENGNELKKFCTKDAAGFFSIHALGGKVMVLTGRECLATSRRMEELKVEFLVQGIRNKKKYIQEFINDCGIDNEKIAYIGDDLNDLPVMKLCGFVGCPADSCQEVKEIANYISSRNGGNGAVRDVVENVLREQGLWDTAISEVYGVGV